MAVAIRDRDSLVKVAQAAFDSQVEEFVKHVNKHLVQAAQAGIVGCEVDISGREYSFDVITHVRRLLTEKGWKTTSESGQLIIK